MSNPHDVYEHLCANLKIPTDTKIINALIETCKTGELDLAGLSLTAQQCEVLSKVLPHCKDIIKFNVGDCLLPVQGLAALLSTMHSTNVHTLQLRGNNIAGPSVYKLSKMISRSTNIKNLGLEWNNLGLCSEGMNQFCNALASNRALEALDLRNNQLDEGCAVLLATALRKNAILRALDVRWNSMEQVGGQHLLAGLQTNKTLTTLRLQGNSVSNDLLTAIDQCVQHNLNMLRLESGYEARKELLANHVRAISSQRAQELRDWADKSQRQVSEMDLKVKEMQGLLASKQEKVEELEAVVSETKRLVETKQSQAENLREELRLQEQTHTAVVRDYQLQIDTLNKALIANKSILTSMEEKLEAEKNLRGDAERKSEREKEKIRQLEQEIERRKGELQTAITEHTDAVEQERSQFQQRLALVTEEWSVRLEQSAAEHSRAEQVYRDRLRVLETALEAAESSRIELATQWAGEKAKWAEEKSNIWAEAKEKESCRVVMLTERVEHLKEEKTSLENQLSLVNTTTQQLQRDNSVMVADLADLRRKLSSVHEELSSERLLTQKLRSEKAEDLRLLESSRSELMAAQRSVAEANDRQDQLRREVRKLTDKLEDKERQMTTIRKEEKERASLLVAAVKNYIETINSGHP